MLLIGSVSTSFDIKPQFHSNPQEGHCPHFLFCTLSMSAVADFICYYEKQSGRGWHLILKQLTPSSIAQESQDTPAREADPRQREKDALALDITVEHPFHFLCDMILLICSGKPKRSVA